MIHNCRCSWHETDLPKLASDPVVPCPAYHTTAGAARATTMITTDQAHSYQTPERLLDALPKRVSGQVCQVTLQVQGGFSPAPPRMCSARRLEIGSMLRARCRVDPSGRVIDIFTTGELAGRTLGVTKGRSFSARVRMMFGLERERECGPDGPLERNWPVKGMLINDLQEASVSSQPGASNRRNQEEEVTGDG